MKDLKLALEYSTYQGTYIYDICTWCTKLHNSGKIQNADKRLQKCRFICRLDLNLCQWHTFYLNRLAGEFVRDTLQLGAGRVEPPENKNRPV
jgi:hypothetical protein